MEIKVLSLFCAVLFFLIENISCNLYDGVVAEDFQPTLMRLKQLADDRLKSNQEHYKNLDLQMKHDIELAKNETNGKITQLKNIIANDKAKTRNSSIAQACIRPYENQANQLSSTYLSNCYPVGGMNTMFNSARTNLSLISAAVGNGITYCTKLFPLEAEKESVGLCCDRTIADSSIQLNKIQSEFYKIGNVTLNTCITCLTNTVADLLFTAEKIKFSLNYCLV